MNALLLALAALAPQDGRALASDYVRAAPGAAREALRAELAEQVAPDAVRALAAALAKKGLVYTAGSESEALREGETEDRLALTDGFSFEAQGRRWTYAVGLPSGYGPRERYPLVVDPGHGLMRTREERLEAGQTGVFLGALAGEDAIFLRTNVLVECGSDDDRAALQREHGAAWFAAVYDAAIADALGRFAIDPDRVHAIGLSQSGYYTWQLAAHSAWRFAAVQPQVAVLRDARGWLTNCVGLPVYVLTGEKDTTTPPEEARWAASTLKRLASPVHYEEIEGAGHGAWLTGCRDGVEWMLEQRRGPLPRRAALVLRAAGPRLGPFFRIDELAGDPAPDAAAALIDVEVDGQTVRIASDDVRRLTLQLSDALLDLDEPVRVEWNGKTVHEGVVEPSLDALLGSLAERVDAARVFPAELALSL
ncbi:MAG: hypothetical protein AAF682_10880 [Planctomycetota bacterium]